MNAEQQNDGRSVKGVHALLLALLLIAPALAGVRLGQRHGGWLVSVWYAALSAVTWFIYHDDKRRARQGAWRVPEKSLHLLELAGGWPGAFLAQRQLRHKVSKLGFQLVFWLIVAVHQFVAVDFLRGWQMTHALIAMTASR